MLAKQKRKIKFRNICQKKLLSSFFSQLQIYDEAYETIHCDIQEQPQKVVPESICS